ncbi:MAG: hypothetical protein OEZ06_02150 [Myxococcales bacterium]|nr:hypothetical protein [Myxococcales bacterium]
MPAADNASAEAAPTVRRYLGGVEAIERALDAAEAVRVLLVERDDSDPSVLALVARAEASGVRIWRGGPGDLRRMSRGEPERVVAMVGPDPTPDFERVLTDGGAIWLLHRARYPSNVGFALRTAEVSGASALIVDATFNHDERSRVSHVSMGADRLLPLFYRSSEDVLTAARAAGRRLVALEDVGRHAPWQVDLRGPLLLIAGSERHGLGQDLLDRVDAVVRLPMAGFIPSYNLQAAIAALSVERLRQSSSFQTTDGG